VRFAQDQKNLGAADTLDANSLGVVQKAKGYSLLDLYVYYNFNNKATLKFGVDNLTDEYYALPVRLKDADSGDTYFLPEPGRQLWLKFSWQF
jgi:outer membrane receptor protein involved in Fe transport